MPISITLSFWALSKLLFQKLL